MQETVVILLFVFHTDYTPAYHLELAQLGSAIPMIPPGPLCGGVHLDERFSERRNQEGPMNRG